MTAVHTFKRMAATLGLLMVTPIALHLLTGSITPLDAGARALALFGGVILIRRLANLAPTPEIVDVQQTPASGEAQAKPADAG